MTYYFYKCADESYAPHADYFDHSHGIAGFRTVQQRAKYMGCMTIEELNKVLARRGTKSAQSGVFGHRAGYTKANYNYRH